MQLALSLLGLTSLFELLLWIHLPRQARLVVASLVVLGLSGSTGLLVGQHWGFWAALTLFVSVYRAINVLRVVEGRTPFVYLLHVVRVTSFSLILSQVVITSLWLATKKVSITHKHVLYVAACLELFITALLLLLTYKHTKKMQELPASAAYADRDLPAVTVAIPARNETDDLEACLQSLIASTYPKLEILVLDDCSQNKRTPEIIRSFAHDGVRFIGGDIPPEHWLAKNYAYEELTEAANGELILFCGVDVRFAPETLTQLVTLQLRQKLAMISVMPQNTLPGKLESLLVQPVRYGWELVLPSFWLRRPPVLSTCWLIQAAVLHKYGSFKAITQSSIVEGYFARRITKAGEGYRFIASNESIGLKCAKPAQEQRATAIRTRYPQMHRRPEIVAFFTFSEVLLFLGPLVIAGIALLRQYWLLLALSIANYALLALLFVLITRVTYRKFISKSIYLPVLAAAYDIAILNYSMWQYEFRAVIWKGRNVCVPLMHVVPKLPDLPT